MVQSKSSSTCGLHTVYFIIRIIDAKNRSKYVEMVNVGEFVTCHYAVKEGTTKLKDQVVRELHPKKNKIAAPPCQGRFVCFF